MPISGFRQCLKAFAQKCVLASVYSVIMPDERAMMGMKHTLGRWVEVSGHSLEIWTVLWWDRMHTYGMCTQKTDTHTHTHTHAHARTHTHTRACTHTLLGALSLWTKCSVHVKKIYLYHTLAWLWVAQSRYPLKQVYHISVACVRTVCAMEDTWCHPILTSFILLLTHCVTATAAILRCDKKRAHENLTNVHVFLHLAGNTTYVYTYIHTYPSDLKHRLLYMLYGVGLIQACPNTRQMPSIVG